MRGLFNRRFLALWTICFLQGMATAPAVDQFMVYVESLGWRPFGSGALRALGLGLGGVSALVGGDLSDRLGRKPTFLLGLAGGIATTAVFLFRNPLVLLWLLVCGGLASGFQTAAGQTYMMDAVPATSLGLATAAYFQGLTAGKSLGNLGGGQLAKRYGFPLLGGVTTALAALLAAAALLFLPSLPRSAGGSAGGLRALSSGYARVIRRRDLQILIGLRFLPTCYWGAVTFLIPLLLFRLTGSEAQAANYTGVSLLAAATAQILIGRRCDVGGRKGPVLVSSLGITGSALGLALFPETVVGLYLFGILGAMSAWSLSTTMPGLINDLAGPEEKGRVLGITHLAWSAGMVLGNLGAGWGVEWNAALPFAVATGCCVVTVVLGVLLFRVRPAVGRKPEAGGRK